MLKKWRRYANIGRFCGIKKSTVGYMKKDGKDIKATARVIFNKISNGHNLAQNVIVKMESALALWVSDCTKRFIALDTHKIRENISQLC